MADETFYKYFKMATIFLELSRYSFFPMIKICDF